MVALATLLLSPPQGERILVVDPAGQNYPAVHGPLHSTVASLFAHPNRPPGHSREVPLTQKLPESQGSVPFRVVTVPPTVNSPSGTRVGWPLPAGQYSSIEPQGERMLVVDPSGQ
jgi:hypothetical protein